MDNKNTTTVRSGGIGFTGLLTIVFVICKIIGVIEWSWWWVFSPIWISWLIVIGIVIIFAIIAIISACVD